MNYLPRLRALFQGNGLHAEPTEPTKVPSVSFGGVPGKPFPQMQPAELLRRMRAGPYAGLAVQRWAGAVACFALLVERGVVAEALAADWDARELVGVQVTKPHDAPHRAGLIFSLRAGDTVRGIRREGCTIISDHGEPHLWLRCPLPADGSVLLAWEFKCPAIGGNKKTGEILNRGSSPTSGVWPASSPGQRNLTEAGMQT